MFHGVIYRTIVATLPFGPLSPSSDLMYWFQLSSNQTQTPLKSCLHVPGATESSSEASQLEVPCPEFPVIFLRILNSGMRYQLSSVPDLKLQKARRQPKKLDWSVPRK